MSAGALAGQTPVTQTAGGSRFFLGGSFGMSTASVDVHQNVGCLAAGETQISLHGGFRIRHALYLEGILTGRMELGRGCAELAGPGPLPGDMHSYTNARQDTASYPLASIAARLLFEPGAASANIRPRLFAGVGLITGVDFPYFTVGAGVSGGGQRTRFLLDVSGEWMSEYELVRRTYRYEAESGWGLIREEPMGNARQSGVVVRLGFQRFVGHRPE